MNVHYITERRIKKYFISGLSPQARRSVFNHLPNCSECASLFNRLHNMEAHLCGYVEPSLRDAERPILNQTVFMLERIEKSIFEESTQAPKQKFVDQYIFANKIPVLAALALLLIGIGFPLLLQRPIDPLTPSEHPYESDKVAILDDVALSEMVFQSKGSQLSSHTLQDIGVRIFVVSSPSENQSASVREKGEFDIADTITFTYTNTASNVKYLTLFSVQQNGDIHWYYPDYGQDASIPIKPNVVDEPLGDGIRLNVNHQEGWIRVTAIFSEGPIFTQTVVSRIEDLQRAGTLQNETPIVKQCNGPKGAPCHVYEHSIRTSISSSSLNGSSNRQQQDR